MSDSLSTVGVALVVAIVALAIRLASRPTPAGFPGPAALPIIGTVIPLHKRWEQLAEWGQLHGPIYALRLLGNDILVLNSAPIANELLEKRSARYSARPIPRMITLSGMDQGIVFQGDPRRSRQARKMLHSALQPKALKTRDGDINKHVNIFLGNLRKDPNEFVRHLDTALAGITLAISHGFDVKDHLDPFLLEAGHTVHNFAAASQPGAFFVELIPQLLAFPAWLPGMSFKRKAAGWKDQYLKLANMGHDRVKAMMVEGISPPNMTMEALSSPSYSPDDEEIIMNAATEVYTGGADTTVSTFSSFILAMLRNPEIMARAQREIDEVVPLDRLPTLDDRESLPFVQNIIHEVVRHYPPIPTIVRTPIEDDVYEGRLIKKGTTIIVNVWGMLHDPMLFENPNSFNPDRWFDDSTPKPSDVAFGFGRRVCPGFYLAQDLLFMMVASTLAAFDIRRAKDAQGNEIVPEANFSDGGIIVPLPFDCDIQPRGSRLQSQTSAS